MELDEEAPKQDGSLPEPLLIIMSPPPPYLPVPGEPTILWHKWLKAFEHYVEVLGEDKLVDATKCALLQNCLGPEGQRVFTSLIRGQTTYAAAISVLTDHFSADAKSQASRLKFHQRAQMPGETLDQFVSALEEMLTQCNYGDSPDKLLLNHVIAKTNCPQLRDRLLSEKDPLSLATALVISREVESAVNQPELCGVHEVSVDIGDDAEPPVKKAKRGRPRRGEQRTRGAVAKAPTRASSYKDNYYYSSDVLYYSDSDKSRNNVDNGVLSKAESVGNCNSDEEDFIVSKSKGPNCPICVDRRFRDVNKLARHMRTHTKEKPFGCPVCAVAFSQSYHLSRHLRNQHGAGQHVCLACGVSFTSFAELRGHKEAHAPRLTPSADGRGELDAPVRRKRGRPRRVREEMETQASSHTDGPSSGDLCCSDNEEAPKTSVGESSNNEASSSSQPADEDGCDEPTGRKDVDVGDDFVIAPSGSPHCPLCRNRRFRNAHKLARHMRTHTKEKPFRCPVCAAAFSQSYHMTRHLRNQHGAGQHVCATCGMSFGSFVELKSHKRKHVSEFLSCPNCEEKFTDDVAFLSHIKTHDKAGSETGRHQDVADPSENKGGDSNDRFAEGGGDSIDDASVIKTEDKESDEAQSQDGGSKTKKASKTKPKGHFCPICVNRCFRGSNKLARHMRTHTKEKPFTCPVCSLTFSQSYHMTRHLRKQHGLGQYICPKCGKNLSSWLELKAHKRSHAVEGLTCIACEKQFCDKATLVNHLKLHKKVQQSSPRSLICGDCGKVFGRMYHLKRHIMTHRKAASGERYKCPDCQKNFAFPEELNKHMAVHLKENNGTCPRCDKTFRSPEELEAHMGVHEKSYACDTCGKKFKVEYALKKHEQGHQHEQYYCAMCCKHFIKLSHYKRHVLVHDRRESKCPHCDTVFLQLTALKYHLRTHTEERPYQCTCCIETFEDKDTLEQHCLKHRKFKKERPYSCTRCDLAFATLLELTEHMAVHEGEQPQNCPICGKTFLNKKKLEKHLSIHTGERRHLCSICGNGFPSAASLKLHMHVHTGEKPFQCPQCSKRFRSNSGLRLHSRQHWEVRPSYKCPDCGRTYGRMTELKMHQRYHTGDKPYACTCCSKRFISKDKLNVHMRIHTGERPYSCPHCGQTFTQTGDRNRHISKCH